MERRIRQDTQRRSRVTSEMAEVVLLELNSPRSTQIKFNVDGWASDFAQHSRPTGEESELLARSAR